VVDWTQAYQAVLVVASAVALAAAAVALASVLVR
jgi:hypothetical protein